MHENVSIDANVRAYRFEGRAPARAFVEALFAWAAGGVAPGGAATLAVMHRALGLAGPASVGDVHNLVTTAGLAGLAYNASGTGNADGDTFGYDSSGEREGSFLVGSGTTAPALGDTALATLEGTYEDHFIVATQHLLIVGYYLTGPKRDALAAASKTISEVGLQTNNSGSGKASDNILFARAVFEAADRIAITTTTSVVYIWNFAFRWASVSGDVGLDQGLHYFATRMQNLATYGAIDRFLVGSGATKQDEWETGLVTQTHAITATYSSAAAVLSSSGTLAQGGGGGASIVEYGPGVDGLGPLYQCRSGGTSDNVNNNTAWTASITFANVVTADRRITHTGDFRVTHVPDNRIVAEVI